MKIIAVIPARYKSSRFPGKPLIDIKGKPMVYWVYKHAIASNCFDDVIVATESNKVYDACKKLKIKCAVTSDKHDTPTSRIYEISTKYKADYYVFVGADEPLIKGKEIKKIVAEALKRKAYVLNAMTIIKESTEVIDVANIKISANKNGKLLYATRAVVPFPKGNLDYDYMKFVGVGVFSKEALEFYNKTAKGIIEKTEECDLLRYIENGKTVDMFEIQTTNISIDTPKDLEQLKIMIRENKCTL